jgi:hypothetical protein
LVVPKIVTDEVPSAPLSVKTISKELQLSKHQTDLDSMNLNMAWNPLNPGNEKDVFGILDQQEQFVASDMYNEVLHPNDLIEFSKSKAMELNLFI